MRLNPGQIFILNNVYIVLTVVYDGASATYKYTAYCSNDARIYDRSFDSVKEHRDFVKLCKIL